MIAIRTNVIDNARQISSVDVQRASRDDVPDLVELISRSIPDSSPHTVWDLPWTWSRYRVVRGVDGGIVAAGALAPLESLRFEIRGLTVDPTAQGRGFATAIMRELLADADAGGRETVCMTRKPGFFERFGFRCTTPQWLPKHRWPSFEESDREPRIAMTRPAAIGAAS